jgi:hypothetical protein
MTQKYTEQKIDNIPTLNQFIEMNSTALLRNKSNLELWEDAINDFITIIQKLRVIFCQEAKNQNIKQEEETKYYHASLGFFAKHFLASIERLVQGHVSYGFHCRIAVELSLILYLYHKKDITFDEMKNGKHDPKSNKRKPINIYKYREKFEKDVNLQEEETRVYPLIRKATLNFLDYTSELAIHPNYDNVTLAAYWVSYPFEKYEKNKLPRCVKNILRHMSICLEIYIEALQE